MLEVGKKLKAERERQGLSVKDISIKTHFNVSHIEAIERGDLDYFKDDLSYVKFFVQFYCKTLNMDYSLFKEDFDQNMITYTEMLSKQEVDMLKETNERIFKKVNETAKNKKKAKYKSRINIDASLISMLLISITMITVLVFAFGKYIYPNLINPNKDGQSTLPPVTIVDKPIITSKNEQPVSCEIQVNKVNFNNYEIAYNKGCQNVELKLNFGQRTWIRALIDGVETEIPKTYEPNDEIIYTLIPESNSSLVLHMGYFKGNVFAVNNSEFELDDSIKNSTTGNTVTFTLKGE